jgi:hypothetical protein
MMAIPLVTAALLGPCAVAWLIVGWPRALNEKRARRYVTENLAAASKIDPAAFPPGAVVVYWPAITNERQRIALERAEDAR